ncbi:MAG: hypothetical protein JW902_12800 [Syntrophaceae bacterium]|nr:hypothetical protein [Syntrophaceae bacterium]
MADAFSEQFVCLSASIIMYCSGVAPVKVGDEEIVIQGTHPSAEVLYFCFFVFSEVSVMEFLAERFVYLFMPR